MRRADRRRGVEHEHVIGQVYGHPTTPDGTMITTSPVIAHEGRCVVTASGSVYELDGDPIAAAARPAPGRAA